MKTTARVQTHTMTLEFEDTRQTGLLWGNAKNQAHPVSYSAFLNHVNQYFFHTQLQSSSVNKLLCCIVKAVTCQLAEDNLPPLKCG